MAHTPWLGLLRLLMVAPEISIEDVIVVKAGMGKGQSVQEQFCALANKGKANEVIISSNRIVFIKMINAKVQNKDTI